MGRPEFPRTIIEFQSRFPDEVACWEYLAQSRWPEGYRCPRCDCQSAAVLEGRRLWQCSACRYQVSVTAGTVLHKTHTALHLWFWAAYLMSTPTPGVSALQLQRQLGLSRYETAWTMLHKLRRAMVNPERQPLAEEVEVDECFVGGHQAGLRGGRAHGTKALVAVAVAVAVRGVGSGPGALARKRGPFHGARSASRSTDGPRRSQPDKHDAAMSRGGPNDSPQPTTPSDVVSLRSVAVRAGGRAFDAP